VPAKATYRAIPASAADRNRAAVLNGAFNFVQRCVQAASSGAGGLKLAARRRRPEIRRLIRQMAQENSICRPSRRFRLRRSISRFTPAKSAEGVG